MSIRSLECGKRESATGEDGGEHKQEGDGEERLEGHAGERVVGQEVNQSRACS